MRSQFSTLIALLVAALLVGDPSTSLAAGGAPGGGGVGNSGPSGAREGRSPERKAESEYARGLRKRDNAWKHEAKATEATTLKRRTKELKKAAKDWQAAEKRYRKALKLKSKYHQAYSSLGYALRKQGRYPDAIAAYDRALAIQPRYAEAIEYRAEAYLGLDRIRKAVDSYMRLFTLDREKAAQLLTAMETWLRDASSDHPSEVAPDTLEWFRKFVAGRKEIANRAPSDALTARSW